jgi:TatA/E family protein of Tat protein translocase
VFGVSATELVIILALALLLLGPDQLPPLARTVGRAMRELQKASADFESSVERQLQQAQEEPLPAEKPASPDVAR